MNIVTDQTGRVVRITSSPRRIISLVPSQTELLYTLRLEEEVAGITKFCVHPQKWFLSKPRVGGTKQLKMDMIHSLQPDLIIANKEENVKEQVQKLAQQYPVWVSDVTNLEDAYCMIKQVGQLTGKHKQADELVVQIERSFAGLTVNNPPLPTVYLVWKDPYMTVGGDTFIHDMLKRAGFSNLFGNRQRYPVISLAELKAAAPEMLLLSSEPFPFKQKHIEELQNHLPQTKIMLADGEMFSWYGSRLLYAAAYFTKLQKQITESDQPLSG